MTVVIVEDEIRIREGIIGLINRFYPDIINIRQAKSGREGLNVIREVKPELVITDISMEPMDGLEMLCILRKEGHGFKAVILSAYSEFEFAKRALSLGAVEYLVKPVDVGEFKAMMTRVLDEIEREQQQRRAKPEQLISLKGILTGLLHGRITLDDDICSYLAEQHRIESDNKMVLLAAYLGDAYNENAQAIANMLQTMLHRDDTPSYELIFVQSESLLLFIFYNENDLNWLERYLQVSVVRLFNMRSSTSVLFGYTVSDGIAQLQKSLGQLKESLSWAITLGNDMMIIPEQITSTKPPPLTYPVVFEKDSLDAICSMEYDKLKINAGQFMIACTSEAYPPDSVKKATVRYLLSLLNVVKELNYSTYEAIDETQILDGINRVVTYEELERLVMASIEKMKPRQISTTGPLVAKAVRVVEEYYHKGITLEEIATTLHMTPEHISAQFVKELGVNFSTYIRNYRIQKAKELLLSTDLKMYEVAGRVGYNDPKYFSKVFRECEGVLPVDYRKTHRKN